MERIDELLISLSDIAYRGAGKGESEYWPEYDRVDGQITSELAALRQQLAAVTAQRDALKAALEPFAADADGIEDDLRSGLYVGYGDDLYRLLSTTDLLQRLMTTTDDLHAAHAALDTLSSAKK